MKTITVRIGKDGKAEVETSGYVGQECQVATRRVEEALGHVTSDQAKPEMLDVEAKVEQ